MQTADGAEPGSGGDASLSAPVSIRRPRASRGFVAPGTEGPLSLRRGRPDLRLVQTAPQGAGLRPDWRAIGRALADMDDDALAALEDLVASGVMSAIELVTRLGDRAVAFAAVLGEAGMARGIGGSLRMTTSGLAAWYRLMEISDDR